MTKRILEAESCRELGFREMTTDSAMAKVSIVGAGIQNAPGYASRMFAALAEAGVNIEIISTSEIPHHLHDRRGPGRDRRPCPAQGLRARESPSRWWQEESGAARHRRGSEDGRVTTQRRVSLATRAVPIGPLHQRHRSEAG